MYANFNYAIGAYTKTSINALHMQLSTPSQSMSAHSKQRSAKQCHGELVSVQGKVSADKSPEAVLQCMHMTWLAVSILADGRPPNRFQVHDILFPIGKCGEALAHVSGKDSSC